MWNVKSFFLVSFSLMKENIWWYCWGEERKGYGCIVRLGWPICQHCLDLNWTGLKKMGPGVGSGTVLLQCTIIKAIVQLDLLISSISCDLFLEESKTTHTCN